MNISCNWLRRYIDFSLSPADLAAALTSTGLETGSVEEVESIRGGLKGLVVGRVLTCEPHPDSDHLHVTTVDVGAPEPLPIVCGAPNVAAGQTVIVATVGTTLYDGDKEFKIKKSKIRGVESLGMICAEDEIGVGTSHDGIIVIPDGPACPKPGTPAAAHFKLESDWVLEVDLTPNRIDAASHYGVARDLSAWLAVHNTPSQLHRPSVEAFKIERPEGGIPVEVATPEAVTRYCGVTIRGVRVAESPQWLRDSLVAVGLRPINNIVDITNYILLGLGQPLHCFDLAKIKGGRVVVGTKPDGTPFTTLDGVERRLDARDLMICNADEPMCMAGVFGGLDSGVTAETTDVFIESACFHPTWVRKTARRHGLSTDSSFRFERGVDPNLALYAAKLAALMVQEMAGGEVCGPVADYYPAPVAPYTVDLEYAYVRSLIGKDIPDAEIDRLLALLEIEVTGRPTEGVARLAVPTYRFDVRRPCDVVEEILRIYGYNNVETGERVSSCLSRRTLTDIACALRTSLSRRLAGAGFNEILNNSLTAVAYYDQTDPRWPLDHCVRLLNPLSQDLGVMRQTLLYGGLESIAHNINRRLPDLRFFEFGHVYSVEPGSESKMECPLAPYTEQGRLGIWVTGAYRPANWARQAEAATVFDVKAIVANLLAVLGIADMAATFRPDPDSPRRLLSPRLGTIEDVDPATLRRFSIKQPVAYAELNWDELVRLAAKRDPLFAPLPKTHPVKRDLALLIDAAVSFDDVASTIRKAGGRLLRTVDLFDVYEGDKLPKGKKSYAVTMNLQDDEATLNDRQIDGVMDKIIRAVTSRLGAELR